MSSTIAKRVLATCALSLVLALSSTSASADVLKPRRKDPAGRKPASLAVTAESLLTRAWRWIAHTWDEAGSMIDPNGGLLPSVPQTPEGGEDSNS